MASKFKRIAKWICKDVRDEYARQQGWRYGAYNPRLETLAKTQRCRECGKQITADASALTFTWNTSEYGYRYWNRLVYIHVNACTKWTEVNRAMAPFAQ